MRILFDSKKTGFKDPFGTLVPEQSCKLNILIPVSVRTSAVRCVLCREDGSELSQLPLCKADTQNLYERWSGSISFAEPGLYFYYFRITGHTGTFRLFKQGDDTNMEAGDLWQVSCIPEDFTTPDWAKGAVIYQIFPDRFHRSGSCDLAGKQQPYTLHENWEEEVVWQPDARGKILNNDFFGGNFRGITEKLPHIAALGTGILYLNPICKSFSNHRYDTGDYKTPDPMLGTEEDFSQLCEAAHKLGIRVILDGVFSHTGADSLYFDRKGTFGGDGAYSSKKSPYYTWYTFRKYPDDYKCWWDFDTLPTVNKMDPAFIRYIITDDDSVVAHWLSLGADGFRLDVADELPDAFLALLKKRVRQIKPDALVIGEVWEDASNKIAYDIRRRYFTDGELDSVMNYPLRTAILDLLWGKDDGRHFRSTVMTLTENYPPQVLACCMNLLGTHDTPRLLTALVDDFDGPREALAARQLSPQQRGLAKQRLLAATFLQFTLPGAPSIYYGDEAGMEGGKDPFNRRTFPWGKEDPAILAHFRSLGWLRKEHAAISAGTLEFLHSEHRRIGFRRTLNGKSIRIYVNLSADRWEIPVGKLLLGHRLYTVTPSQLILEGMGFCALED